MKELTTREEIRQVLEEARTVAVLGAHVAARKPAHYVPGYLHGKGYRILPVNPALAGETLWGETVRSTLAELRQPVDVVDRNAASVVRRQGRVRELGVGHPSHASPSSSTFKPILSRLSKNGRGSTNAACVQTPGFGSLSICWTVAATGIAVNKYGSG